MRGADKQGDKETAQEGNRFLIVLPCQHTLKRKKKNYARAQIAA